MFKNVRFDLSDYLVAEIAVVDQSGWIVHCNRKWDETATIGMLAFKPMGWNYDEECVAAIRRGCADAVVILNGLRSVLLGELPSFVAHYSCPLMGCIIGLGFDFGPRNRGRTSCHVDAC